MMSEDSIVPLRNPVVRTGRAATFNPASRFDRVHYVDEPQAMEESDLKVPTQFYVDHSKSALSRNDSPDVPFTFSLNPYRGCEHGCIYCYARPSHEYLGFSGGLDFESRILVKENAPVLLAKAFESKAWEPQVVALSGNTDPYQPVERKLGLTRRCLEVFREYRNPVSVITKNQLLLRDQDILADLALRNLVHVTVSITSLRQEIIRVMEPRTTSPNGRLKIIEQLARCGISVGVNVAPVIPGLTDEELPEIVRRAADAGAVKANYMIVRLPGCVKELFLEWLNRQFPDRSSKVIQRLRELRGDRLTDPRFKSRHCGEGEWSEVINRLFQMSCRKSGVANGNISLSTSHFRRRRDCQTNLF